MEYLSSPREFKDFMRSTIWRDFKHELDEWLNDIHLSLEDPSRDMPDKTLHRLGGSAEVVRRVLKMPEVIIMNIEDDLRVDEAEREGD